MTEHSISRRKAFFGAAALAGAGTAGLPAFEVAARAPLLRTQAPYY